MTTVRLTAADEIRERVEAGRASRAFENYLTVRERVLAIKDLEGVGSYAPSEYWDEELRSFEYMFDASPLIVERLRHHCHHITGLRVYDYRSNRRNAQKKFEEKLGALLTVGRRELLISEARALGGYGFDIDGELYNLDTLKFFEVLIALDRAAVLNELQDSNQRRVVWEIGSGWGGFAYQLKSLCPNVTYVISDFPELFLFSAVYLMTLFPEARCRFWGECSTATLFQDWQGVDFIFVPASQLDAVRPERVDLTINMVSFQEMTSEQVDGYARYAYELGSPYLYSLNRERSPYNDQLKSVREIISRYYWPREIPVLPVSYTQMLDEQQTDLFSRAKSAWAGLGPAKPKLFYPHLLGWRRVTK